VLELGVRAFGENGISSHEIYFRGCIDCIKMKHMALFIITLKSMMH